MAGFVKEVIPRSFSLDLVSDALSLPWTDREK